MWPPRIYVCISNHALRKPLLPGVSFARQKPQALTQALPRLLLLKFHQDQAAGLEEEPVALSSLVKPLSRLEAAQIFYQSLGVPWTPCMVVSGCPAWLQHKHMHVCIQKHTHCK